MKKVPVQFQGEVVYRQRLRQSGKDGRWEGVRCFERAESQVRLPSGTVVHRLPRELSRIWTWVGPNNRLASYSPDGLLTREQLDLVELPVDAALVMDLLALLGDEPRQELPSWLLGELFRVEAVEVAEGRVARDGGGADSLARYRIEGKVQGAILGAESVVRFQGRLQWDRSRNVLRELTLQWTEQRGISHVEPGFQMDSTLTMQWEPLAEEARGAVAFPEGELAPRSGQDLLAFRSLGGFVLALSRKWYVLVDRPDLTILRMVDRGDLIAQCNISRLDPLPETQSFDLAAFQENIRRATGDSFRGIVAADQGRSPQGVEWYRVVCQGVVSELPVQWIHYHLARGRKDRVALVFTADAGTADRLALEDLAIVGTLQFLQGGAAGEASGDRRPGN